ncbi:MAG TPA: amidohydrolase family protein [Acidimicrobiales bacterium]|nr:amidohydrolase family protein [Acidimicrobiales bacterium]
MGYIDCDTHVIEPDQVWDYFDPGERYLSPTLNDGYWTVEDHLVQWPGPMMKKWRDAVFPGCDLADVDARLRYMDDFGVDVQMLYTSWWLLYPTWSPAAEAALYRSYNRWVADRVAEAGGRLRWAVMAPVMTMERAFEELDFGRDHGAAAVFLLGQNAGMSLANPTMFPLYERAQDLGLAITVHVGNDLRAARRDPGNAMYNGLMVLPGAFYALLWGGLTDRFPRLRWAFVEGGASWLPWVLRETFRADETGAFRSFRDWRSCTADALRDKHVYIAAQVDDDLPELVDIVGPDRLVYGTDYGHLDVGSDPDGLNLMANRPDVTSEVARRIVDTNGRRLLGIEERFCPAPPASRTELPPDRVAVGLPAPG